MAVFGALLGVAVGWCFRGGRHLGFALRFGERHPHPLATLAVSAAAGLVTAIGPARQAGRMNGLDAIAYK